jgi:predicted RNA binding protein YcfA (HicA-like mRNA interferase family)
MQERMWQENRMGKLEKLRDRILSGTSDTNIEFKQLCNLISKLGFEERVRGDHHIFTKAGIDEIINIQPIGSKAKAYQVKQIRNIIIEYHLGDQNVD